MRSTPRRDVGTHGLFVNKPISTAVLCLLDYFDTKLIELKWFVKSRVSILLYLLQNFSKHLRNRIRRYVKQLFFQMWNSDLPKVSFVDRMLFNFFSHNHAAASCSIYIPYTYGYVDIMFSKKSIVFKLSRNQMLRLELVQCMMWEDSNPELSSFRFNFVI